MKKYIFSTLLFICCQTTFAEYAIIDKIVYSLNFNDLTATVLNFQTSTNEPCTITIPERVKYKNDIYTVTKLSYYAFDYDALSEYETTAMIFGSDLASMGMSRSFKREQEEMSFQYDYDRARACIEYINLPNTLLSIKGGSFKGMMRLKHLRIPSSVTTFTNVEHPSDNLLDGSFPSRNAFPRLEVIEVLGIPTCKRFDFKTMKSYELNILSKSPDGKRFNYQSQMALLIAGRDSSGVSLVCPNLSLFIMPAAHTKLTELIEIKKYCKKRNRELNDIADEYNKRLRNELYYDGSHLIVSNIEFQEDCTYNTIDEQYRQKEDSIIQKYNELVNGRMEANIRKKDPARYIHLYAKNNPQEQWAIDSLQHEYRCMPLLYTKIFLYYIDNHYVDEQELGVVPCREAQFKQFRSLFANQTEFNQQYDKAQTSSEFDEELKNRQASKDTLTELKNILTGNPSVKLQGLNMAKKDIPQKIASLLAYLEEHYYYQDAVNDIFTNNLPIQKEFGKNGKYFTSRQSFFNAYISAEYNTILKSNKKMWSKNNL